MRMKANETNYDSFVHKLWYGFVYNLLEILIDHVATLELTECETGPKQCAKSCYLFVLKVASWVYDIGEDELNVEEMNICRLFD